MISQAVAVASVRGVAISLRGCPWDIGPLTPSQIQNKVIEEVTQEDEAGNAVNPNGVVRTRRISWVDRYHRNGRLSDLQMIIATELSDAALGQQHQDPLTALRVDRSPGEYDVEAARVDGRAKFRRMWLLVPGFARPVVEHVVLQDGSLRSMGGDTSSAGAARQLARLQRGLDALAAGWRGGDERGLQISVDPTR